MEIYKLTPFRICDKRTISVLRAVDAEFYVSVVHPSTQIVLGIHRRQTVSDLQVDGSECDSVKILDASPYNRKCDTFERKIQN